jgi:anti-sigma B factor antagonist
MKFKSKEQKGLTIISLEGNVMGGPDASLLNELLHKLVKEGKKKVILDLAAVKLMNSSGLGMLIAALTTMRNASGDLKIAAASKKIENLFIITKLTNLFEHHKTVKKAVDSYK